MIKFDIKDMRITWKELIHDEFQALVDFDKTKTKEKAIKDLKTVFFLADKSSENSYRDIPFYATEKEIIKVIYNGKKPKEDHWKLIEIAIKKYEELNDTAENRLEFICNKKMDQITEYLSISSINKENISDMMKVFKEIPLIIKAKEQLIMSIRKDTASKTRANAEPSPSEQGAFE